MAVGMGQRAGQFSSPDSPYAGMQSWEELSGIQTDDPFVGGPGVGGAEVDLANPAALAGTTGLVHVSTGRTPAEVTGLKHWSELFNFRDSPMPYLLVLVLVFMGIIQLQVAARVGK